MGTCDNSTDMSDNSSVSGKDNNIECVTNPSVWNNLRFEKFYSQDLHCDITLLTSPHSSSSARVEVKAHKIILAEASPYFFQKLGHKDFLESRGKHFVVPQIENVALEHLIRFIYTGTLKLSHENLPTIFQGSKLLELVEATRKCEAFLIEGLNTENVWQRFKLCMKMESINLPKIIGYIKNSWDTVISCADFLELAYMDLMDFVSVTCEEYAPFLLKSINDWVNHHEETRAAVLLNLLKLIPVKAIPALTWLEYFSSPKIKDIPGFQDFAHNTLTFVCLLQADIINSSQQTPVQKINVSATLVKKEEVETDDEDDVVFVPTPPNPTAVIKSEKVSSSPFQGPESSNPAFIPSKSCTTKADCNSCPLPQKRNLQQVSIQSCKKFRPDIKATDESMSDFKVIIKPNRSTHCYPGGLPHGRLIYLDNTGTPATCDMRTVPRIEIVNFINQNLVCLDESVGKNGCLAYYCNKLYNVGGVSEGEVATNAVFSFDFVRNKWKTEADLVLARRNHTVVELEGYLYVIGGSSGKHGLKNVESLDLKAVSQNWKTEVRSMTYRREAHGTVVYQRRLYVIGGYSQSSDGRSTCLDSMEFYDSERNRWTSTSRMESKRCGMAVAVFKDKLYVIGGGNELKAKKRLRSFEVYNFKADKWTTNANRLNHGRQNGSAVVLDGNLYVIGGDSSSNPTVEVFRPDDEKWEVVAGFLTNQCSYKSIAVKS